MRRAALLWLALFAAYAATVALPATPGEDLGATEAQTLLTVESLVSDGDLDLRDDFGARAWRDFYGGELVPVAGPREGRVLEPVGLGFTVLVAPAYALGGREGTQLWLAALAALGFVLAAALARRLVPEPWATTAALVGGLSPPALVASTTVAPDAVGATAVAGAALLALRVRERPRLRWSFWCAALVAALPWLALKLAAPGTVVAWALARWLRRRRRALAGLAAVEVVLFSAVVFITVNDRLYGGLTPYAVLPAGVSPTGADGVGDHLARAPRLLGLWLDGDVGLVRWAPFAVLALGALWLLARSRRERLAVAVPDQVDVEVTAGFLAAVCAATVLVATFAAPTIAGPWFAGHELVAVGPCAAALAAWGLRHAPRTGRGLAALTLLAGVWVLAAARLDDGAGTAPPAGPLPWAGAERVLPELR